MLDLWLMVAVFVWIFDSALAAVLNHARFDLGWYAGRVYGLLASSFVLAVLLLENGRLYAVLAEAYADERRERARAEARTAELAAVNKELDAFSYSVSHDLRAPLRAIDGYSRMIEEDYGERLDEEGRRLLAVVRGSSQKMGMLIDDLLGLSRVGRSELARAQVDMAALVREVRLELGEASPAQVELEGMPDGYGDRALLKQVWANLMHNALKYSGKRERPRVEIGGRADGAETIYWVRDNGVGFDMKYYDKLFGVFQRLHGADEFPGTGIGLAIVQRVVARHGGRVWAEGKTGRGRGVLLRVADGGRIDGRCRAGRDPSGRRRSGRRRDDAARPAPEQPRQPRALGEGRRRGARVHVPFRWLRRSRPRHTPKLIMLDIKMPKVDGIEVLRRLKANEATCTVPVVVMTSSNEEQDVMESYRLGVNSYIVKPVHFDSFVETVAKIGLYWVLTNRVPQ